MTPTDNKRGQSGSLILRALEPEDVDTLYLWENDVAEWHSRHNMTPLSRYQIWQYIQSYDGTLYGGNQLRLMVCLADSTPIGTVDLYDIDAANRRAWVGIYIAPQWRNCGHALETLRRIGRYAHDYLAIAHLAAETDADNAASCRLFEKAGYSLGGCLHAWRYYGGCAHDVRIYQCDCI